MIKLRSLAEAPGSSQVKSAAQPEIILVSPELLS